MSDNLLLTDSSDLYLAEGATELLLLSAGLGLTVAVEFGFGSTWQTDPGDIVWYNETDRVLVFPRIRTRRGASAARGAIDPGTVELALLNIDRRFDPLHADGPYFGLLKPGVPIRVQVFPTDQPGAVLFRGTVPSWPQRYDVSNRFAYVPLQGYDGFDKLARAKIPRSVLEKEILADSPVGYWPMNETSGTVLSPAGTAGIGTYTVGATSLTETGAASSGHEIRGIRFDGDHAASTSEASTVPGERPWVVECLLQQDFTDGQSETVYAAGLGNPLDGATLVSVVNADNEWIVLGAVIDGSANNLASSTPVGHTGAVHHVAMRCPAVGATQLYADGENVTASNSSYTTSAVVATGTTLGTVKLVDPEPASLLHALLAHVAVFDSDIGAVRLAAHADAALAPLDGQTTDERIDWILDELGWPATARDFETGQTSLGPATFQPGDKALDYLRLVNASEDGLLYVTADGTLRFLDRYWRYTATAATTSQFTFTDADPDDAGYAEFQIDLDDELLVNVARLSRRGGTEQVATDADSVEEYGEAEIQQGDLLLRTDNEVLSLAEWKVATGKTPLPRCPVIRVPLHRYPAVNQQTVLALDLGHRVSVVRTPQGVGDPIELDLIVDGVEHDIGGGEWWLSLFVSPVPEASLSPFRWGVSEWDGSDAWAY